MLKLRSLGKGWGVVKVIKLGFSGGGRVLETEKKGKKKNQENDKNYA